MAIDKKNHESIKVRLLRRRRIAQNGCWLWQGYTNEFGHGNITIAQKNMYTHRVAYEVFSGKAIPQGLVIRHRCDEPSCFNPDHLQTGSHADNVADRVKRHRSAKGVKHGRSRLTPQKVKTIWTEGRLGKSISSLADRFGVSLRAITLILAGKNWAWLTKTLR